MRLDKFLKVSRLIKRRSVAKELASRDIFLVNDKPCKPSKEIKEGDKIDLLLGRHHLVVEVLSTKDHCLKEDAHLLYKVILDEIKEEDIIETN